MPRVRRATGRRRWGEPAVPTTPAVTRRAAAVADLLAIQVELVAAGTSPLVNATIAWDLEHGTCERQSVYKLVWLPRLRRSSLVRTGSA